MKLLLCVASIDDIKPALENLSVVTQPVSSSFSFLYAAKILTHEVEILESGAGIYQTVYKTTKVLTRQKYHLALKLSFGNAYKAETELGRVLNIINEKPGDFGMEVNSEWKDLYDLGLLKREEKPHVRGGYINLTNSYMNVFAPFKKAVGVTVNQYADIPATALRAEKYKADCETGDGLGFAYTCLFETQAFYHLAVMERNLATGGEDFDAAKNVLNETLIDLIKKL